MPVSTKKSNIPLLHEVEIIYSAPSMLTPVKIKSSNDCFKVFEAVYDKRKIDFKEFFYVLLVNRAGYCLGVSKIGMGSTAGTAINIKEIFQLAIKANASGIIISHNHPSGNLTPSEPDKQLTNNVREGAKLLDINLLDHIIMTSQGYYSFADNGL